MLERKDRDVNYHWRLYFNVREKGRGQLRMDNPETLATLCTQDTGQKNHKKTKKMSNTTQPTTRGGVNYIYIYI